MKKIVVFLFVVFLLFPFVPATAQSLEWQDIRDAVLGRNKSATQEMDLNKDSKVDVADVIKCLNDNPIPTASMVGEHVGILFSVFVGISAQAGQDSEQTAAIAASEHWLSLADAGRYRECWESASEYMKQSIRQKEWERSLADMLEPLGKTVSRKLKTVQSETGLPGAPCFKCFRDRRYFIISYETSFENNTSVTETLTPMADSDGKWRIFDYHIRKSQR